MIDAWTGPPPTPQQFPTNEPDGIKRLLDKIKGIETEMRDMRSHLPGAGGIGNAMLASPVSADDIYGATSNFALTTTMTTLLTSTITVPPGFTRAVVTAMSRVIAVNPGAADFLYAQTFIDVVSGNALPLSVSGGGGSGINVAPFTALLFGLTSGGTFNVTAKARTAFAGWAIDAANVVDVSGAVFWLR